MKLTYRKGGKIQDKGGATAGRLWPHSESDNFSVERQLFRQGYTAIGGLDEVGRGPLAGPVVAACVILPQLDDFVQFTDSKKLSAARRVRLSDELEKIGALVGVAVVSEKEIDRINILQASLLAMRKAAQSLSTSPDYLLVDGNKPVPLPTPQQTLVKGELKSASIAAASIVAKVHRDRLMEEYHHRYPHYNFLKNKGYPTAEHRAALKEFGPCPIHRRSFRGVRECLEKNPVQENLYW
jgi:ribonuclease HII